MNGPVNQAEAEEKAFRLMVEWSAQAKAVVQAFRDAQVQLPPSLRRFLGESFEIEKPVEDQFIVPPLPWPQKPPGFTEGWICVKTADLLITNLVVGILLHGRTPMKVQAIHDAAKPYDPDVRLVTVHNVGKRLEDEGIVRRADDGWVLQDATKAPILFGDYAWAHPSLFAGKELASYRRFVLLHVIRSATPKGGLMIMQVVKAMQEFPDFKLDTITKDMVGDDFDLMKKQGLVDRIEETRKWVVVSESRHAAPAISDNHLFGK